MPLRRKTETPRAGGLRLFPIWRMIPNSPVIPRSEGKAYEYLHHFGAGRPSDGRPMPGYGFGRCAAHGDESIRAVRRAVRDGYRHTGSAAMSGGEAETGKAAGLRRAACGSVRLVENPAHALRGPGRRVCGIPQQPASERAGQRRRPRRRSPHLHGNTTP